MAAKKSNSKSNTKKKTKKNSVQNVSDLKKSKNKAPQKPRTGKKTVEKAVEPKSKRPLISLMFLAFGLFILAVLIIPGKRLWTGMQGFFYGILGYCAFLFPFILLYAAVVTAMEKKRPKPLKNIFFAAATTLFVASIFFLFGNKEVFFEKSTYWEYVVEAYKTGISSMNGGFFGALFGGLLVKMFGKTCAIITDLILIFASFMLWTGTTTRKLFMGIYNSADKAKKKANEIKADKQSKREENNDDIDEEFDDDFDDEVSIDIPNFISRKIEDIPIGPSKDNSKKSSRKKEKRIEPTGIEELDNDDFVAENFEDDFPFEDEKPETTRTEKVTTEGKKYKLPPIDCLKKRLSSEGASDEDINITAQKLVETLRSYNVESEVISVSKGPSVTRYEIKPAPGVRINRITALSNEIAMNLASSSSIRIEAPIPGKSAVGIEVPNGVKSLVSIREIIESAKYNSAKSKLNVALGKDIAGNIQCADLSKMPHLLIAGTTGSGKSVCMNTMILSLLFNATPDEVKLLMIDPKKVEFRVYNGIPHLLVPVVDDAKKAAGALAWAVTEMTNRYRLFSELGARDIEDYNFHAANDPSMPKMQQIVIFIDELSDLMMAAPGEVEASICRLAQMARAAGIYLVIATQRPSVDVITGLIKANIPSRISLMVSSQIDSRTIIDSVGAESLLGNGDMLFKPVGINKPVRIQGCFVSTEEINDVVSHIKNQETTEYDDNIIKEIDRQAAMSNKKVKGSVSFSDSDDDEDKKSDVLLPQAIDIAFENNCISVSVLQRRLSVGYARAGKLVDMLEQIGIAGPYEGAKPRKLLITKQEWQERQALSDNDDFDNQDNIDDGEPF